MIFMGCDPGDKGGVALVEEGNLVYVGRFARETPVAHALQLQRRGLIAPGNISPWLEEVEGWPGEDVKSIFTFGRMVGKAEDMFELLDLKPNYIRAKDWQAEIGWKGHYAKRNAKEKREYKKARKAWIWERMQNQFDVKLYKDVADAIAIAYAASLKWGL